MPFLTQEPWVYDWGVSGCRLPQCLSGLAGSVPGCYLLFCVCLCVLFCVSEKMRPMKLFVLGFRVVAHISMLPVRGAHASVFPHPLFLFCDLIVTFPPGVIRMNLWTFEPLGVWEHATCVRVWSSWYENAKASQIALPCDAINSSTVVMSDVENDSNSKPPDGMDEKNDLTTPDNVGDNAFLEQQWKIAYIM